MCLLLALQAEVGQNRPVVLVGHSLGGLVLKKLAVEAMKQATMERSDFSPCCKAFCNNLAGTFFFATPHGGSEWGGRERAVLTPIGQAGPVLDYLTVFSEQGAKLNCEFMNWFPTLKLMALVETKKIKVNGSPIHDCLTTALKQCLWWR